MQLQRLLCNVGSVGQVMLTLDLDNVLLREACENECTMVHGLRFFLSVSALKAWARVLTRALPSIG